MLPISAQRTLKRLGIALAVPLSLYLTLTSVLSLPPVQANHHMAPRPFRPGDLSSVPGASSTGADVSISGFAFNPSIITMTEGTTVTWTNFDSFAHTTTSDIGSSDAWDSGSLGPGELFTKTLNTLGTYTYHCAIHPGMTGVVVVVRHVYLPLVLR
jgi:plastocyanin